MAKTIFVVGHAKAPKTMSATDVYSTLSVAMIVEERHGVILEASCSLITESGRNFISRILVGESLLDTSAIVETAIAERYHGAAQAAIQAAWKDAVFQFRQHKENSTYPVS